MYNLQKVEISAHLEHFEAKLYFFQKFISWLKMKHFCQLHFVMQSGNTLVSMLRPCSFSAGKFEMDNENGSRGVLQKTSSIKETLMSVRLLNFSLGYTKLVTLVGENQHTLRKL